MSAQVTINPALTSNAAGTFNAQSGGLIQGQAYPDPSTRFRLREGILSSLETLPMWGGVGITELVPGAAGGPIGALGPIVRRATALTGSLPLTAFSVFDQAYGMINSPQSPVPLIGSGGQVMSYRLGSKARLAVACDPVLLDLQGGPINADVSWDFGNQQLAPYASTTLTSGPASYPTAATISSGTYNATTGAVSLVTNAAHGLAVGQSFTLNGMTGTGAIAALDGTFIATTGTTGTTLNFTVAVGLTLTITGGNLGQVGVTVVTSAAHGLLPGDPFVLSALTGTGASQLDGEYIAQVGTTGTTLVFSATSGYTITSITGGTLATGGILPVDVLDVQSTNCMTVSFNSATGFATWNYNACCALIQI